MWNVWKSFLRTVIVVVLICYFGLTSPPFLLFLLWSNTPDGFGCWICSLNQRSVCEKTAHFQRVQQHVLPISSPPSHPACVSTTATNSCQHLDRRFPNHSLNPVKRQRKSNLVSPKEKMQFWGINKVGAYCEFIILKALFLHECYYNALINNREVDSLLFILFIVNRVHIYLWTLFTNYSQCVYDAV